MTEKRHTTQEDATTNSNIISPTFDRLQQSSSLKEQSTATPYANSAKSQLPKHKTPEVNSGTNAREVLTKYQDICRIKEKGNAQVPQSKSKIDWIS